MKILNFLSKMWCYYAHLSSYNKGKIERGLPHVCDVCGGSWN